MKGQFFAVLGVVVGMVLFMVFIMGLRYRLQFPGQLAEIEQLRLDAGKVGVGSNEDVIGQVTKWNQEIKSNQRYRKIWWSRAIVPAGWDGVAVIEIGSPASR